MRKMFLVLALGLTLAFGSGCSYRNVDFLKAQGPSFLESQGYKIVVYEGYEGAFSIVAGGRVWYQVVRKDNPSIIYNCYLEKWDNEIHLYGIKALNVTAQN